MPRLAHAAPIDTVLSALAAEAAAPIERARLFILRGEVAEVYFIDRVTPGRFRVIKNPRQGGSELVIVDGLLRAFPGAPVTPQQLKVDEQGMPLPPAPPAAPAPAASK